MKVTRSFKSLGAVLGMASMMIMSSSLHAAIQGLEMSTVHLYAKQEQITTPDGDSIRIWGFATSAGGDAQYPGPTIIVNEGDTVMVTVHNTDLPQNVSLLFPGQDDLTRECSMDGTTYMASTCQNLDAGASNVVPGVTNLDSIKYSFTAKPGTYMYHSGVSPQIQIDMGLVGALIVRPTMDAGFAYNDPATAFEREFLFFLSEMDPKLHYLAENGGLDQWDNAAYQSQLFFINGRNAPDTLAPDNAASASTAQFFPHQPYGALVKTVPGERVLMRVLNVGRTQHPLHTHGNHFDQVARDGNLLTTGGAGSTALGPIKDYTLNAIPGSTADLIWEWTGRRMGWDIFDSRTNHGTCDAADDTINNRTGLPGADGFHDVTWEWCADHGKPLPVVLPEDQDLAFGGFWGGSPFLGDSATIPIGEGGLNPSGGMVFMWHSHSERELTNNDIFPGGMLTMMIVERRP